MILNGPTGQKKCQQKDTKAIKNESRSGEIENFNNCIIAYPINEESSSQLKHMISWVKNTRTFKKNASKSRK